MTSNIGNFFVCGQCGKHVKTAQGLKSHTTRLHGSTRSVDTTQGSNGQPSQHNTALPDQSFRSADESDIEELEEEGSFISFLVSQKNKVKVIRRIPKGARVAAAEALSDCIQLCVRNNCERTWKCLLRFAGSCLQVPSNSRSSGVRVSLATAVKRNISTFRSRDPIISHSVANASAQFPFRSRGTSADNDHFVKSVESKIADGDVVGAIRILGSEDSFAPFDDHTLQALLALHPSQEEPTTWPEPVADRLQNFTISETDVKGVILSFPPGSTGGIDLLNPQHLKDLISHSTGAAGQRLLTSLVDILSIMFRGEVPATIVPVLYGASLCALNKKGGGIRPIAIGCTLRRLAAKIGSNFMKPSLGPSIFPTQLGFGTRGGAEAAAHAARRFISFKHARPKVFLKMDFANAFNSIRRDVLLAAIRSQFPDLYPFMAQCYRHTTTLFFGNHTIPSQRGVQQGDPLGPALFCLTLQSLVASLKSELNIWYLDDAAVGGDPEVVLEDLMTVQSKAAELGLSLNPSKCELFSLNSIDSDWDLIKSRFSVAAPGIRFPNAQECSLLGAPLQPEAVGQCLSSKSSTLRRISSRLSLIKAHPAFFILKNSLAIPKLTYLLRCSPTWDNGTDLGEFDSLLREALNSVINIQLTDDAWIQSSLPVKQGGLGIRHASSLALPAFLASASSVDSLVKSILPQYIASTQDETLMKGITAWENLYQTRAPPTECAHSQKVWEEPAIRASKDNLYERATKLQDKARLLGVVSREAGSFLNALPSPALGTLLDDNAFRISVALRVGAKICQPHTCVCGQEVGEYGLHGLSCKKNAGRITRHNTVNDLLRRGLVSAGIPNTLEPSFLIREANLRPDGVTQIPWKDGKSLAWDYTCVDSQAISYLTSSSGIPLYAATEAENSKRRKYSGFDNAFIFAPIASECLGSFGKESAKLLRDIGQKIASNTGERRAAEFFLQRISVAIQRGNAIAIMATIPPQASLEDYICLI